MKATCLWINHPMTATWRWQRTRWEKKETNIAYFDRFEGPGNHILSGAHYNCMLIRRHAKLFSRGFDGWILVDNMWDEIRFTNGRICANAHPFKSWLPPLVKEYFIKIKKIKSKFFLIKLVVILFIIIIYYAFPFTPLWFIFSLFFLLILK